MVVIAMVAIIAVFALPDFSAFIAKRRVNGIVNQLAASVRLAKSEAQIAGRNVSLCAANADGLSCKGGTDWSSGWMVYVQGDAAGEVQKVLQVYQTEELNLSILLTAPATGVITVTPAGMSQSEAVIKVKPKNLASELGKTMSYENVTLMLSIVDGV